jgi:undecaprenyl-diphosphatase
MLTRSANHSKLWLAFAAVGILAGKRHRRAAIRGMAAIAGTSFLANAVLKPLTRRPRPLLDRTPLVRRLRRQPTSTSFPSGHAASAAAFATGVALESPVAGAALAPLAATVGYSRMHVGVHHFEDVIAGAALGAGVAFATRRWFAVRPAEPAVRQWVQSPALAGGEGLVVVVNPRSGSGLSGSGFAEVPLPGNQRWNLIGSTTEEIRRRLPAAEIVELDEGSDPAAELGRRAATAKAFGAGGGDGTVAAAAAAALRHGLPLAVFPAGTFNHFARDLGLESAADTARALEAGAAVAVDVAVAGGVPFLNTAVIGAYPELVRRRRLLAGSAGKWLAMAVAAGQVLRRQQPLRLTIDGRPVMVWTLFVGNCRYAPRGLVPAGRPRLDDGLLDVQYLRADIPLSRTRAVLAVLAGVSERSNTYRTRLVGELRVGSLDGPVRIARDGELGERGTEFRYGKLPGRLLVYRP